MLQLSSVINSEDAIRSREGTGGIVELGIGGGVVIAPIATGGRVTPSSFTFVGRALLI